MIIVDFSAISIGAVVAQKLPADEDILRHVILNSLRSIYVKNRKKYGSEMIIACDHSSWRRQEWEFYKWQRRQDRDSTQEKSDEWTKIFEIIGKVRAEIDTFLPWKVVHVYGAEADDVIATIAKTTLEFGKFQPVLIVSADSDFKQLLAHSHIQQWNPSLKKAVKAPEDHVAWLVEAIVKGQGGKDGIPNIKSPANFWPLKAEGKVSRQTVISAKFLETVYEAYRDEVLESVLTADELDRFCFNQRLIDFDFIPVEIRERVLSAYRSASSDSSNITQYFMEKRLRMLLKNLEDFV